MRAISLPGAIVLFATACAGSPPASPATAPPPSAQPSGASVTAPAPKANNPLLAPWGGPHGGVPPFAQVSVAHFKPALEAAMEEERQQVAAIAADPAPPTFENTIAAR